MQLVSLSAKYNLFHFFQSVRFSLALKPLNVHCLEMFQHSSPEMFRHSSPEMFRHSSPEMFRHSSPEMFQHSSPEMFRHSSPEMFRHSSPEMFQGSERFFSVMGCSCARIRDRPNYVIIWRRWDSVRADNCIYITIGSYLVEAQYHAFREMTRESQSQGYWSRNTHHS